jgi:hypothetical protein
MLNAIVQFGVPEITQKFGKRPAVPTRSGASRTGFPRRSLGTSKIGWAVPTMSARPSPKCADQPPISKPAVRVFNRPWSAKNVRAFSPARCRDRTLGQLGHLQCRPISPQIGVLPPPSPRSAANKGWPRWPTFAAGGARRCKTMCCRNDSDLGEIGQHYVGQLGQVQCRPISPQIGVSLPPSPRPATNKGWPRWPTFPQAAQRGARQSVAAMTPISEKHGLHWLANMAIFSVGDVSPKLASCRLHRRDRPQTKVGHVGPLLRRRHNAMQDKMLCRKDSGFGETRTTLGPLGSLGCLNRRPRRATSPHRLPCRTRYFNMPGGESIR